MMHFNGETWPRILILLCALIVSSSCLRGSELILQAARAKQQAPPSSSSSSSNATATEGEVSGAEGTNSTAGEKSLLTGIPQIDYIHDPNLPRELNGYNLSNYPFYNAIPKDIDFKCDGLHDGFYASVPHHCQVYHHCLYGIRYDFLCANYTAFDQKTFICHFVSEVDCNNSPKYYQRNEALYKSASTSAPIVIKTTTTKATTEAPSKKNEEEVRRPGPYRHRRPPFRRRPAYEYYDNGDDYYDDYYYYGPPVRKRPNRNKGYRGDYYGGERSGGHKSIHRDAPRRKPIKPIYEEDDEEYEYYYDSADGSRDDDDRRRPLDNNYRKPLERDRPYQNKKRDKDSRFSDGSLRNDKKKRVEEENTSRKNDDDKRLRNKYLNKSFTSRSKYDRDEYDLEETDNPRRYQEDKRDKYQKNKSSSESMKYRPKLNQKTTPSPMDEEEYDDIIVTPKWKSRFQANPRRPGKDDSKKSGYSREEDSSERKSSSEVNKEKSGEVTESSVSAVSVNPSIYARQPSKLYSQVKVETRPPQVQRNKDHHKADIPATTMSSYRKPLNLRSGAKEKMPAEVERPKPLPKYTTPSTPDLDEYEDEDSLLEDTAPAKTYYEEDVSETDLTDQFPSKAAPTTQKPSRNLREQTQTESTTKSPKVKNTGTEQRFSSFNQRFKPAAERQTTSAPTKQPTTERQQINRQPPVTENQFSYSKQPVEESQTLSYLRQQQVTERQPYNSERQQFSSERLPFSSERQTFSSERQSYNSQRQPFIPERQSFSSESQEFKSERQPFIAERQPFNAERQPYNSERQPFTSERQPYTERQQFTYTKQPITERQPQISYQRQPYVERQPTAYAKQPVTERLVPFQKQQITTERQIIPYAKLPVTDRQLVPFKQIVTERQIIPYLRQEAERKPVPFPKQPPRTFEITAPGPSGLGSRIEVSDSIPRGKYVIQGDRPTGFSLRLQQSEYSSPLQPSTQIQRRPEEPSQDKIVTRPSFKPVRNFRSKPTPEPQYHDSVRLDSFPQRYLTGTEEYEPVVVPNPRLSVIPQISHVSNSKEWYW